tara:strand:- start:9273 stop:9890 length:618 start_codon:yes stop_codon:yes gene_type:complete
MCTISVRTYQRVARRLASSWRETEAQTKDRSKKVRFNRWGLLLDTVVLLVLGGGTRFSGLPDSLFRQFDSQDVLVSPCSADASSAEPSRWAKRSSERIARHVMVRTSKSVPTGVRRCRTAACRLHPTTTAGNTWHHDGQSLFAVIEFVAVKFTGPDIELDMPAHAEFQTADEIPAVLAGIQQEWSAKTRELNGEINKRAGNPKQL